MAFPCLPVVCPNSGCRSIAFIFIYFFIRAKVYLIVRFNGDLDFRTFFDRACLPALAALLATTPAICAAASTPGIPLVGKPSKAPPVTSFVASALGLPGT